MHYNIGKKLWLMIAVVPLLTALEASPAFADPLTISLVSPSSPTVTEGNSITLLFDVTNSSSSTYTAVGNGQSFSYVSGDISDMPIFDNYNYSPVGFTGCASPLAPGGTCYFSASYDTPSDSGESDHDSGVYQVLNTITFSAPGQPLDFPSINTDITVQDAPAISSAPEPTSLAILGAALAGAFAKRRRNAKT